MSKPDFRYIIPIYHHALCVYFTKERWNKALPDYPKDIQWGTALNHQKESTIHMGLFVPPTHECFQKVLVHELGHVCINLFHNIGMDVNLETQEAFCYLIGDLTKVVNQEVKRRAKTKRAKK